MVYYSDNSNYGNFFVLNSFKHLLPLSTKIKRTIAVSIAGGHL